MVLVFGMPSLLVGPTDVGEHGPNGWQTDATQAPKSTILTPQSGRLLHGHARCGLLLGTERGHRKLRQTSGVLALCDDWPQFGVLGLLVAAQVHFPLERTAAQVAGEGLEARVLPRVGDQVRGLAEGLAAHRALVGLLAWKEEAIINQNHNDKVG